MADPVLGPAQVGDAFKVTIQQTLYNQKIMNVLWYEIATLTGGPFDRWAVQLALANKLASLDNVVDKMKACQSNAVQYNSIQVSSYRLLADRLPYTRVALDGTGALSEAAGTSNTAASIEKRALPTAGKPRTGVGRFQLGGIPTGGYTGGVITTAEMLLLADLASQLEAGATVLTSVILLPVLVTWGPTNILMHDIFQCMPQDTVRVMSRRTVGRGE